MTTAREHMAADMAWLYAREGEEVRDVVIDGVPTRAMVQELEVLPGPFEGSARRRLAISLQKGTVSPLPRPDFAMTIDGEVWTVESVNPLGLLDVLTMAQYS